MKISDLTPENAPAIEQVAELLVTGFGDTGSASWRTMGEAIKEVRNSFQPGRLSRIAVDEQRGVLGWIGGIEEYDGNVWELHPLVVRQDCQRQGVGRTLVADFERQVAERCGHTVRLGTDDENFRTTLGGVDMYPNVLDKLRAIENVRGHPFEFYLKVGYHIVGVIPDANGYGKPDILMAKEDLAAFQRYRGEQIMSEKQRRLFFVTIFALVFYLVGASFVQSFVTYPTWKEVGPGEFEAYYQVLSSRIIRIMVLPGVLEIFLTAALLWLRPRAIPRWPIALALGLNVVRFASTALIQLRIREQLNIGGLSPEAINGMIQGDYLTQASSIARALLYGWMMFRLVGREGS